MQRVSQRVATRVLARNSRAVAKRFSSTHSAPGPKSNFDWKVLLVPTFAGLGLTYMFSDKIGIDTYTHKHLVGLTKHEPVPEPADEPSKVEEPVLNSGADSETEPETEPETELETESETESETEPETESESEPATPEPETQGEEQSSESGDAATPGSQEGAYNPETGEINWDCPCLGGMANGPCGPEFKEAFACFVYSKAEPKGVDCIEKFRGMQECFRKYPDVYAEELRDDDAEYETGEPSVAKSEAVAQSEPAASQPEIQAETEPAA